MKKLCFFLVVSVLGFTHDTLYSQGVSNQIQSNSIVPAAERISTYLPLLKGKKIGVFANHTSLVGNTHLVDTLKSLGINIVLIFAPEHGFRGEADAGEKVGDTKDAKTGIQIVSLYGKKRRPTPSELAKVDILIFDIQDVGLRYYTYISSLEEFMNAAFEAAKPLLVLDRPNPNGFYIDGPVLEKGFNSFVGMQPIPIVYGMTIGEYGMMLAGERWLSEKANRYFEYAQKSEPTKDTAFHFLVIKCSGYHHKSSYQLPIAPSPNLPNMQSIYLYASTCFFEGTDLSLGRGTDKPFQVYGHPTLPNHLYSFTPRSVPGAKNPPQLNNTCYGFDLSKEKIDISLPQWQQIQLTYLMDAYKIFPDKANFWLKPSKQNPEPRDYFFNLLAGNETLKKQIMEGVSEEEIRKSWQPGIEAFKQIRKKYLIYPDFE